VDNAVDDLDVLLAYHAMPSGPMQPVKLLLHVHGNVFLNVVLCQSFIGNVNRLLLKLVRHCDEKSGPSSSVRIGSNLLSTLLLTAFIGSWREPSRAERSEEAPSAISQKLRVDLCSRSLQCSS
jgi:hypothetical protein